MSTDRETATALWARVQEALGNLDALSDEDVTPRSVASRADSILGNTRISLFVGGFYYPNLYGDGEGELSSEQAETIVLNLESRVPFERSAPDPSSRRDDHESHAEEGEENDFRDTELVTDGDDVFRVIDRKIDGKNEQEEALECEKRHEPDGGIADDPWVEAWRLGPGGDENSAANFRPGAWAHVAVGLLFAAGGLYLWSIDQLQAGRSLMLVGSFLFVQMGIFRVFREVRPEYGLRTLLSWLADLDSENSRIRKDAASALGLIEKSEAETILATKALVAIMQDQDEDWEVRYTAAWSLGMIGPRSRSAVPILSKTLEDPDNLVRRGAAESLGNMGFRIGPAVPALIKALNAEAQSDILNEMLKALGQLGPLARESVPAIASLLARPCYGGVQATPPIAADTLAKLGIHAREAVPALIEALQAADEEVRPHVAAALGAVGGPRAQIVSALVPCLEDPSPSLRLSAASSLATIDPHQTMAFDVLIDSLGNADDHIRTMTLYALGKLGSRAEPAVPAIRALLSREVKWYNQNTAICSLGLIGPAALSAVPDLIGRVSKGNFDNINVIAEALGRIGSGYREAAARLVEAFQEAKGEARNQIAFALLAIGEHRTQAMDQLKSSMSSDDTNLRRSATIVLGHLSDHEETAARLLAVALEDPDDEVRLEAAKASIRLGRGAKMRNPILAVLIELLDHANRYVREDAWASIQAMDPRVLIRLGIL